MDHTVNDIWKKMNFIVNDEVKKMSEKKKYNLLIGCYLINELNSGCFACMIDNSEGNETEVAPLLCFTTDDLDPDIFINESSEQMEGCTRNNQYIHICASVGRGRIKKNLLEEAIKLIVTEKNPDKLPVLNLARLKLDEGSKNKMHPITYSMLAMSDWNALLDIILNPTYYHYRRMDTFARCLDIVDSNYYYEKYIYRRKNKNKNYESNTTCSDDDDEDDGNEYNLNQRINSVKYQLKDGCVTSWRRIDSGEREDVTGKVIRTAALNNLKEYEDMNMEQDMDTDTDTDTIGKVIRTTALNNLKQYRYSMDT